MTVSAMIFMGLSVSFVVGLVSYCYYKVLTTEENE